MIIAPVIFITITVGIASMNDMKTVGRVAGKAFIYFLSFSTLALIIGLIVSNIVQPGKGLNIDPATLQASSISQYVSKAHDSSLINFILEIIPKTLVSPLSGDNILQILVIAILLGIAISQTMPKSKLVLDFFEALAHPVFKIVSILMKLAPIGAFGAIAYTIGKYGIESMGNLVALVVTFYATSLFFVIVVLGAVARYNVSTFSNF
ncbi:cation:dicarboxylate symporter family transporter [Niabella ginsengisoli]|uniref:cation:dicarboxylate symporter family transporter n=1 Tax=Niabella ginsengisoli TaxID=522298 RepID=UPI00293E9349|nr:cation:dicarboxylase symporter family transporter [Niabella ginsengisoli]